MATAASTNIERVYTRSNDTPIWPEESSLTVPVIASLIARILTPGSSVPGWNKGTVEALVINRSANMQVCVFTQEEGTEAVIGFYRSMPDEFFTGKAQVFDLRNEIPAQAVIDDYVKTKIAKLVEVGKKPRLAGFSLGGMAAQLAAYHHKGHPLIPSLSIDGPGIGKILEGSIDEARAALAVTAIVVPHPINQAGARFGRVIWVKPMALIEGGESSIDLAEEYFGSIQDVFDDLKTAIESNDKAQIRGITTPFGPILAGHTVRWHYLDSFTKIGTLNDFLKGRDIHDATRDAWHLNAGGVGVAIAGAVGQSLLGGVSMSGGRSLKISAAVAVKKAQDGAASVTDSVGFFSTDVADIIGPELKEAAEDVGKVAGMGAKVGVSAIDAGMHRIQGAFDAVMAVETTTCSGFVLNTGAFIVQIHQAIDDAQRE